jgi:phosphate transport system substrate-binding protein
VPAGAGAIGYLPLGLVDAPVKVLSIDGVFPTQENVGDRSYPLRSTIYVIGRQPPPPATFNLLGWIQSEAGQAVVSESYTPLP